LTAVTPLSQAEFTRDLGASFRSIQGTLVHIMWGEWRWLQFWKAGSFTPEIDPASFPDVAALQARWTPLEEEQQEFADGLTDPALAAPRTIVDHSYPLGALIQHLVNHSTYHRGQVVTLLRQLGHPAPATDFRRFLTEAIPETSGRTG